MSLGRVLRIGGTRFAPWPLAGIHWMAPAGLLVCAQSKAYKLPRYCMVNAVGVADQVPSRPLVTVSSPSPVPQVEVHGCQSACRRSLTQSFVRMNAKLRVRASVRYSIVQTLSTL